MVCWFMVVVGFGTIVVAVVPGLGDSDVVAEINLMNKMLPRVEPDQNSFPFSSHLGVT